MNHHHPQASKVHPLKVFIIELFTARAGVHIKQNTSVITKKG